ncbi:phage tail protein [Pseudomonas sp. NyZ480]|uniref:phage tail protein n=1 Tax=Pseudomonas sp. NyZ480 TaxID=3035289 RepID=UPI00240A5E68|nr:phage tail protein [Pseudomonas sp. NyZ480]WEZ90469.1 phage tail protein [Pseudomonas sp. NyZ480]
MAWYRAGTVAIAAGQNTVTGTGTSFSANARVGDAFLGPDGAWYEVTNIASATVLSILPAYKGATVGAGNYAISPIQGYDKSLRDAINAIVQQWGATLAGLGAVSTEDVVPVAKGGTGGTTPSAARSGLGLKAAAIADIVGTVLQSGGVPTGAILEFISNANGDCVKFADGTMICAMESSTTYTATAAQGALFFNNGQTFTYPAPYIAAPKVLPAVVSAGGGGVPLGFSYSRGLSSVGIGAYAVVSGTIFRPGYVAIGRWY